jgi:hypothetical protein
MTLATDIDGTVDVEISHVNCGCLTRSYLNQTDASHSPCRVTSRYATLVKAALPANVVYGSDNRIGIIDHVLHVSIDNFAFVPYYRIGHLEHIVRSHWHMMLLQPSNYLSIVFRTQEIALIHNWQRRPMTYVLEGLLK